MDKIWCLFNIANDYEQPDHNLVSWWKEHPTIEVVAKAAGFKFPNGDDDDTLLSVKLWQGERVRNDYYTHYLKMVGEGEILPRHSY